MKIHIVKYLKYWLAISLIIILIGFSLIAFRGLNLGVDFVEGSSIYAELDVGFDAEDIRDILKSHNLDGTVLSSGQNNKDLIIRLKYTENQQANHELITKDLEEKYDLDRKNISIDFVGPTMGKELIKNATISVLLAGILILIYIWIRFEFKSGVAAIIALIHDVLIVIAVTSIIGIEINSSFIAAILTIVGYSINDTIVIFDRVRENSKQFGRKMSMTEIVDISIKNSFTRTINTSLTTIFAVSALYFLGVDSIKDFTLPILVGLFSGAYSSLFIASPIWAMWDERSKKKSHA